MGRQKKRTMKKYNRSQRKNNTRKKTHKKRVRKTHKKRVRTRKKIGGASDHAGASRHSSLSDGSISESNYKRFPDTPHKQQVKVATAQTATAQTAVQQMSDEELGANQELVNALYLLTLEQFKRTKPELVKPFIKDLASQSEPQKKQLIINYAKAAAPYLFATGLFQPYLLVGALGGLGLTVAAAAVGKAIAFLGSKAGKAAFEAGKTATALFGSTKDKLKLEALTLKIKNCLKTLVDYNVISPTAKEEILKKLRENTGYAIKITRDYNERENQRNKRNAVVKSMKGNQNKGNFSLNVSETPETVVSTGPQQISESESTSTTNDGVGKELSGSYFSSSDIDTAQPTTTVYPAPAGDTTATPQVDLLGLPQLQTPSFSEKSGIDFMGTPSPAGTGFIPALNLDHL